MRDMTCPSSPCEGHGKDGHRSQASKVAPFCCATGGFMTHTSSSKQSCLPCRHHSHQQGCCLSPFAPQGVTLLGLTCRRAPKLAIWGGEMLVDLPSWVDCQILGPIPGPVSAESSCTIWNQSRSGRGSRTPAGHCGCVCIARCLFTGSQWDTETAPSLSTS